MDTPWAALSQHELSTELDSIERAIARSQACNLGTDETGGTRVHVSPELLALAEHQYQVATELRRRRRTATPAA